jgi:hypothetical protein
MTDKISNIKRHCKTKHKSEYLNPTHVKENVAEINESQEIDPANKAYISKKTLIDLAEFFDFMSKKGFCDDEVLYNDIGCTFTEIKEKLRIAIGDT